MLSPLVGGLLTFLQVSLRLDEVRLEQSPGIFLLRLGAPGPAVFLKLPCFRDEAVDDADNLSLYDGLARRGCIVKALVQTCVEAFEWFVGIVGLPELPVVLRQVRCQYSRIVRVEVAEKGLCGGSRVSSERILERVEVCVLKFREELITEGSINVATFVVFSTLFGVLAEERVLVEGGCPRQDSGCATRVGQADEWVSGDEGVLCGRKYKPEVAVLASTTGTLD